MKKMERTVMLRRMSRAYNQYSDIADDADLRRNKLTLAEYEILGRTLQKILKAEAIGTYVINQGVAEWCRRNGLIVDNPHGTHCIASVNYWISAIKHCPD